jgi:hypothetical protein
LGEVVDFRLEGDLDRWAITRWLTTDIPPGEVMNALTTAYEQAYAVDGLWNRESFRLVPSGATKADLRFDDCEGRGWHGSLTVAPSSEALQLAVTVAIERTH